MSTNTVDLVPGTAITLGSNSNSYTMTMKNLAAVYQQSAKIDFGANFAQEYEAELQNKFGSAPTAGNYIGIWIGYSDSGTAGTDNWGGCTGADGAYSGYSGGTALGSLSQLELIGLLILDANAGPQRGIIGRFTPRNRYGYIVWGNLSGQTTTNVDADHVLVLTPLNTRVEAAA